MAYSRAYFCSLSSFVLLSHYHLVCAASLTALFKHIGSVDEPSTDEFIREKVLTFIRDKVSKPCSMMVIATSTMIF